MGHCDWAVDLGLILSSIHYGLFKFISNCYKQKHWQTPKIAPKMLCLDPWMVVGWLVDLLAGLRKNKTKWFAMKLGWRILDVLSNFGTHPDKRPDPEILI